MTVCIAYPHRADAIDPLFHNCLIGALIHDRKHGHITDVIAAQSGPRVAESRNQIVDAFLTSYAGRADWLLFIDTDMSFPADVVDRMLVTAEENDCKILGGLAFIVGSAGRIEPTIKVVTNADPIEMATVWNYPKDALVQCDATGAACLLIHRSVLETLNRPDNPFPWFAEATHSGLGYGEDIAFCLRARAAGFPVHVDTSIKFGHRKPQVIGEDEYADFGRRLKEFGGEQALREHELAKQNLVGAQLR